MKLKHEDEVRKWLNAHPAVSLQDLRSSTQKTHESALRFRYKGLVLTYYSTGTVLLQGKRIGQVVFKGLHCKSCQRKPLVIQGLNYLLKQGDKRHPTQEPPRQHRATEAPRPPVRLEDQHLLWEGSGRD